MAFSFSSDKPAVHQYGFYVSPGFETVVAITPTIVNTTERTINRFSPEIRGCYTDDEFKLKYLEYKQGFRYR